MRLKNDYKCPNSCQNEGTCMEFEVGYFCECIDDWLAMKTSINVR